MALLSAGVRDVRGPGTRRRRVHADPAPRWRERIAAALARRERFGEDEAGVDLQGLAGGAVAGRSGRSSQRTWRIDMVLPVGEAGEGSDGGALLVLAREGDEGAFRALVEAHRAGLHAHCYRMLASWHDAEDALQEALLRAWRALPGFEGRSTLRAWLYKIATNAALDVAKRRSRRELPASYGLPVVRGARSSAPLV